MYEFVDTYKKGSAFSDSCPQFIDRNRFVTHFFLSKHNPVYSRLFDRLHIQLAKEPPLVISERWMPSLTSFLFPCRLWTLTIVAVLLGKKKQEEERYKVWFTNVVVAAPALILLSLDAHI